MKVQWKRGSRVGVAANVAYHELERIRHENDGDLPIEQIVKDSRPENAPLHPAFEWDDAAAAHKYRIEQARYITRSLVTVSEDEDEEEGTRVYELAVASTAPSENSGKPVRVFQSTADILSDPNGREELLRRARRDAEAFRRRYRALSEAALVVEAIDRFVIETEEQPETESA